MSIKGYNFTTPRTEEKRVISIFKLILWNFKILSLILLDRAKKASFLQHCAGCWGLGGGGGGGGEASASRTYRTSTSCADPKGGGGGGVC